MKKTVIKEKRNTINTITRKIQVYVCEEDKEIKKESIHALYQWRDLVRKGANLIVSHKFVQDNIHQFICIKDEIKEKFFVKDILKDESGMSEQNITYRVLSEIMKGIVPADIYTSLNQAVCNSYRETRSDVYTGKASLRSFKNNIPIPFSAKALDSLQWNPSDKRFYFHLFGINFAMALGADRSNNGNIIERCLNINDSYKICGSSLQIDDKKKKMFLLLCLQFPKENIKLDDNKEMEAYLDIETPIIAQIAKKQFKIGCKDEYLHKRMQIQSALRRAQIAAQYAKGGKGRTRKLQATDRFEKAEKNYIDTKVHEYSRRLVDLAIKNECGKIILTSKIQSEEIKEDEFLLRNWTYHGLIDKIKYKCKRVGIKIIIT